MSNEEIMKYLLADADRCAGVVADAYSSWDGESDWREALEKEIEYRIAKADALFEFAKGNKPVSREQYEADMRDAGRGHLLGDL